MTRLLAAVPGGAATWSSDILMDALLQDAAEQLTPADHGDVRDDLRDQVSVLVTGEPVDRPFTDRLVDHYLQRFA